MAAAEVALPPATSAIPAAEHPALHLRKIHAPDASALAYGSSGDAATVRQRWRCRLSGFGLPVSAWRSRRRRRRRVRPPAGEGRHGMQRRMILFSIQSIEHHICHREIAIAGEAIR
ncbi:uncharacterized protein LOC111257018 [Setaria italica]|uniref:uncharacterized protein LOC111257018 n=1 Tax=Setaria italica TaxID=4555 RepID=UPI000BE5AD78|nr:uncharacterized protein LOC111257018 [Setaria italica]